MAITVLVLTPSSRIRTRLSRLLASRSSHRVVGSAWDRKGLKSILEQTRVEVALVSAEQPGTSLRSMVACIKECEPGIRVLVYGPAEQEVVAGCLLEGAEGYLLISTETAKLVRSVADVLNYGLLLDEGVASLMREQLVCLEMAESLGQLTSRERDVLALVARGLDNPTIARSLSISRATVKTHLRRIYGKLGVRSRGELIALAVELSMPEKTWSVHQVDDKKSSAK